MAAVKLVTRCPACRTAFRLVADQLRLRQGLVRCGQCETVFDAREHLIEVPATPASPTPAPSAPSTGALTVEAALAHAEQRQAEARAQETQQPFDPGFDPGYEVPALDSPTMMMAESEAMAGYDEPDTKPKAQPEPEARAIAESGPRADSQDESHPESHADSHSEPQAELQAEPHPEPHAGSPAEPEARSEAGSEADAAPQAASRAEPAPEAEPEPTLPPAVAEPVLPPSAPWPALDHGAFGDVPPPARTPAPAAGIPAAGAYSGSPAAASAASAPSAPSASDPFAAPVIPSASGFLRTESAEARADQSSLPDIPHATGTTGTTGKTDTADATGFAAAPSTAQHWMGHRHDGGQAERPPLAPAGAEPMHAGDGHDNEARDGHDDHDDHHGDRDANPPRTPGFAPDFLRHTRGAQRQREHKVTLPANRRVIARVAVVVLAVAALLQATYLARSQLAGTFPALRPVLEAACAPLHCVVPPWRDLEALRIDSSQLQKQDEATDVYQLAVTMRNQGRATTALPAIELVMTDLQDQLLLRRVLQPAEYLEPTQRAFATSGLRAGTELPVRVRFRTQQAAANYRVLIFYP